MSKILKRNTYLLLIIIVCSSCKKLVEVGAPNSQLVTAGVFNNSAAAISAQTVIYTQMMSNIEPYNIAVTTGLQSDELTNYSTSPLQIQYYVNALKAINSPGPWNNGYKYIYESNAVIEGLQNNNAVNVTIRKHLIGEAEFIRAFWHFYLTNLYGNIPIVTSTNYKVNSQIARSAQTDVYKQIISDLKDAQTHLSDNYLDGSDSTATSERTRPNKWAATALLARAYLYLGNLTNDATSYSNAQSESNAVISVSNYALVLDLNSVFLANSKEAIWQLQMPLPLFNDYNTYEGAYFILNTPPQTGSSNSTTISDQLLSTFEIGDKRRISWTHDTTIATKLYTYPFKYKVSTSSNVTEYSMVLRLAEQYLIRAEAEANGANGGINSAIVDLNVIRNRAGLPNYSGTLDKASVLAAILHERQVEFFTEWGHRWMDLKRTNSINTVMSIVTPLKGGVWNSDWQLYPIPSTEILNDHNLKQNGGY